MPLASHCKTTRNFSHLLSSHEYELPNQGTIHPSMPGRRTLLCNYQSLQNPTYVCQIQTNTIQPKMQRLSESVWYNSHTEEILHIIFNSQSCQGLRCTADCSRPRANLKFHGELPPPSASCLDPNSSTLQSKRSFAATLASED